MIADSPTTARSSRHRWPAAAALLAALLLPGCAANYAKLTRKTPPFQPPAAGTNHPDTFIRALEATRPLEKHRPHEVVGLYLDVAANASRSLAANPADETARATYNFALARALGALDQLGGDPWAAPREFPGAAGGWVLKARPDPRPKWNPSLFRFTPADVFELSGKYVADRKTKDGLGAPLVATNRSGEFVGNDRYAATRTVFYGVTAVARFRGNVCEVSFEDPLATESTVFQGQRYPLAADFTTPLAMLLAHAKPQKLELARLLNPGKYAETARLARLQPYDPKKIPIICVHGLKDSPATWSPMINALRTDPVIRQRYQVWFFSYPSGYPYPHSAALFRKELDEIKSVYPDHQNVILIGHSMGGVISRALVTDAGNSIWNAVINRPPDQLGIDRESKRILRDALIFNARKDVARAIFIAAPHRGSELASNWVGRLGSRLVRAPSTLMNVSQQLKNTVTLDADALAFQRMPNSVDTLSPDNRFVRAINRLPVAPGIPFHSIMGDRGQGGNKDRTPPISSDGIVPYWSSHLDGARSELIVPSNHSAHQHPQTLEEVRRILRQHVRR